MKSHVPDSHADSVESSHRTNPYSPPSEACYQESPPARGTLPSGTSIRFSGHPNREEVDDYLRADAYISLPQLVLTGFASTLLLLALATIGAPFAMISIGMLGMIVITLAVSSLSYRRVVFENLNPNWSDRVEGEIQQDGITLCLKNATTRYRWDWFCGVALGKCSAAFLPTTQTGIPLLVTRRMLQCSSESERDRRWIEVVQVAESLGRITDQQAIDNRLETQTARLLRDTRRDRTIIPPRESIPFQGKFTSRDLARVSGRSTDYTKLLRSRLVSNSLLIFAAIGLAGLSKLMLDHYWTLPAFLLIYVLAWHAHGFRLRKRRTTPSLLYYLHGFAEEDAVTLDMAAYVTTIPWASFQLTNDDEDFLAFRRLNRPQILATRSNMFASAEDWRHFRELALSHTKSSML